MNKCKVVLCFLLVCSLLIVSGCNFFSQQEVRTVRIRDDIRQEASDITEEIYKLYQNSENPADDLAERLFAFSKSNITENDTLTTEEYKLISLVTQVLSDYLDYCLGKDVEDDFLEKVEEIRTMVTTIE